MYYLELQTPFRDTLTKHKISNTTYIIFQGVHYLSCDVIQAFYFADVHSLICLCLRWF